MFLACKNANQDQISDQNECTSEWLWWLNLKVSSEDEFLIAGIITLCVVIRTIHLLRGNASKEYGNIDAPWYKSEDNFMWGGSIANYLRILFFRHFKRNCDFIFYRFCCTFQLLRINKILFRCYISFLFYSFQKALERWSVFEGSIL